MKTLLFDNDGTLIESELICCMGIAERYREEKGLELDHQLMFQRFRGWELERILRTIKEEHQVDWDEGFVTRYRQRMLELFEEHLQAVPGVHKALEQLPYPKAVVSNGPLKKMQNAMRITGLSRFFEDDKLVSAYEIDIWKPDPQIYLYAAGLFKAKAEDCIVIEDSLTGVEAGVKAGMRTLFFNVHNDPCPFDDVVQFNSMSELPKLIAG